MYYVLNLIMAFAQNEAFKILNKAFIQIDFNFIFSVMLSIIVGTISHKLALIEIRRKENRNTDLAGVLNMKFYNGFLISQLSAGYSFIIYILVYAAIFLTRYFI